MKNEKRRFVVVGEIEANGKGFKEHISAYSEAQVIWLVNDKLKKLYPNMKVYLINITVRDITHFNKKEVEMYEKILTTKTK